MGRSGMRRMAARIASLDEDEWDDEEEDWDPVDGIVEGAAELGIELTADQVLEALEQTGLDAEDVSLNQPVLPPGKPLESGIHTFYKGGDIDSNQPGFVTDDAEHAAEYGDVHEIVVECDGSSRSGWTYVHDWDGMPQLVPPGPACSKVTDDGWLILKPAKLVRKL